MLMKHCDAVHLQILSINISMVAWNDFMGQHDLLANSRQTYVRYDWAYRRVEGIKAF